MQIQSIQNQSQSYKKQIAQKQPSFGTYIKMDEQIADDFLDMTESVFTNFRKRFNNLSEFFYGGLGEELKNIKVCVKNLKRDILEHNTNPSNHLLNSETINITNIDYIGLFRNSKNEPKWKSLLGVLNKDDNLCGRTKSVIETDKQDIAAYIQHNMEYANVPSQLQKFLLKGENYKKHIDAKLDSEGLDALKRIPAPESKIEKRVLKDAILARQNDEGFDNAVNHLIKIFEEDRFD